MLPLPLISPVLPPSECRWPPLGTMSVPVLQRRGIWVSVSPSSSVAFRPRERGTRAAMSSSQQRTHIKQRERKLPFLTPDNKFLDRKGKLFESEPFMDSWKNAVLKTKRIKKEYASAYGLSDSSENTAMQCLSQSTEEYPTILNSLPVIQKTQSCADQFPSRRDIAMGHPTKKEVPCISAPLKNSELHCQAGALDAVRLKKLNRCSRLASFPGRVKYRTGYQFADPVNGATSQFLQRLSELAALECTTIHEEKTKRIRKTKKQET
ncbi:hypothetical protein E2320_011462 [Naja naja]|nr:hypothetical protein E2320_011462 [Naja naja]